MMSPCSGTSLRRAPVASAPTVAGGVLYFGSEDHHVYALDVATGDPLWKFETGAAVWSAPTVTGRRRLRQIR